MKKAGPPLNPMEPERAALYFFIMYFAYCVWQIAYPWFGKPIERIFTLP